MTSHAVQIVLEILFALFEFWFLDTMTSYAVQIIFKKNFTCHWRYILLNLRYNRCFLTWALIKLEFCFLHTITSHAVQIILEVLLISRQNGSKTVI